MRCWSWVEKLESEWAWVETCGVVTFCERMVTFCDEMGTFCEGIGTVGLEAGMFCLGPILNPFHPGPQLICDSSLQDRCGLYMQVAE